MKVGDKFYFVNISTGAITKHTVKEIVPPCTQGKVESVKFSNISCAFHPSYFRAINPTPENYFCSNVKTPSQKCYLVFTDKKLALEAVINYVLPSRINEEQENALLLIELHNAKIEKVQSFEKQIEESKKELKTI